MVTRVPRRGSNTFSHFLYVLFLPTYLHYPVSLACGGLLPTYPRGIWSVLRSELPTYPLTLGGRGARRRRKRDPRPENKRKRKAKKEEPMRKEEIRRKSAAPGLPAWSPTAVLPRLEPA